MASCNPPLPKKHSHIQQIVLIGLMTAVICILAPFSILLPFSPIPFSLGTLAIYFATMVLGMKRGSISVLLYLLLGVVGLPIFTGFTGGIGRLLGPTGGYLIGYLFITLICGYFVDHFDNNIPLILLGMICGTALCYTFGTLWYSYISELSFSLALSISVLPFLPTDIIKLFIAITSGLQIRKRLKKAALI